MIELHRKNILPIYGSTAHFLLDREAPWEYASRIAVQIGAGSTNVRLGSTIFGARDYMYSKPKSESSDN